MATPRIASPDLLALMSRGRTSSSPLAPTTPSSLATPTNTIARPDEPKDPFENDLGPPKDPFISETLGAQASQVHRRESAIGKTITLSTRKRLATTPQSRLICFVGIQTSSFRLGVRAAETKVASGTILYVWPDRKRRIASRKSHLDEISVGLTFQSGNIIPQESIKILPSRGAQGVRTMVEFNPPPGIQNFYDFIALMDEDKIMPDGSPNFVVIEYRSNVFPQLEMHGFFTPDGISWDENAENPNQVTWQVTFNCRRTVPAINDARALATFYTSLLRGDPLPGEAASATVGGPRLQRITSGEVLPASEGILV